MNSSTASHHIHAQLTVGGAVTSPETSDTLSPDCSDSSSCILSDSCCTGGGDGVEEDLSSLISVLLHLKEKASYF